MDDQTAFAIALNEAKISYKEGGVPIGAALISKEGKLLGKGHNMRVQEGSAIKHGETSALENSGRLPAVAYKGATMFTTLDAPTKPALVQRQEDVRTDPFIPFEFKGASHGMAFKRLSPCDMCTGACILYGISRVVIGENKTFLGGEKYLKQRSVEVVVLDNKECRELMDLFIKEHPDLWNEDIGVEERVYSKEMK